MINTAIQAAIQAGCEILNIYNDPSSDFLVERKADHSPLTIADKTSDRIIEEFLKTTNIPVLSEEGRNIEFSERKEWKQFWLVDPLDGTKEFIKRNGQFTVNIALIENGKPVKGVIYVPVTHELFVGDNENGAWKISTTNAAITWNEIQEKGTRLPENADKRGYTIAGSRSHMNFKTHRYINQLKKKYGEIEIIRSGSSIKICMVAEGIADEYPRFGPTMEWDTAAGHAIANAAGKKLWLTDLSGELQYNKENLLNPYFIVK